MMKYSRKALVLTLALVFFLGGCGNNDIDSSSEIEEDILNITMLGGSPTGVWYMVTTGISECVNKTYPGSIVQITPGGAAANLPRIGNNEMETGMTHNILALAAKNGKDPFNEKFENITSVASFYSSAFQFVVDENLGITTFDEIINNKMKIKISIDKPGSSAQVLFLRMIEEYGITLEEMESWGCEIYFKSFADSSGMFSDGLIDGFGINTLAPAPPIVESAVGKDMVLLDMNMQKMEILSQKYGYSIYRIPADTYDFLDREVPTIAATSILIASKDVSEDKIYKLTKSIVENIEYMQDVHSALAVLTSKSLTENLGVDMHPGAYRYYKEIGIVD